MTDNVNHLEAIDRLSRRNRRSRDPELERKLVRLRHQAFRQVQNLPGPSVPTRSFPNPFPGLESYPPTIDASDLTTELMGGAVSHHGCLLVRNLIQPGETERLVADIDRAYEARERQLAGEPVETTTPWYEPFTPDPGYPPIPPFRRVWNRDGGSLWAADSPRLLSDILDHFAKAGIVELIADYLGEHPSFAVNKANLRCVTPAARPSWHQDGYFMGEGLQSMNIWVALTSCGGENPVPALDLVPRRLDAFAETGTKGAVLDIEVGPGAVDELMGESTIVRPVFDPGDALFFDEYLLHRTAVDEGMDQDRYAIEWWCFAPSRFPEDYLPMVF